MTTPSQADFAARVVRPLGRLVTLVVGFVMMIVGLAMMVTIVMLPIGIIIGLLGVSVFICAVFAPRTLTELWRGARLTRSRYPGAINRRRVTPISST